MTQANKTFRLFVSSTFSDLKEERNALQKNVFPRLRDLCLQHGCRFQAIDLRWGISEEAGLDQQTMKICLEEIARCQKISPRPNFVVLLGDRYGWLPLPYQIPLPEFLAIEKQVSQADHETLQKWYRRDDNAVPPVYNLLPRSGEYVEYNRWETEENRLRMIFLNAITAAGFAAGARVKYSTSATEQEIVNGAMQVPDSNQHVFGYFRNISNLNEVQSSCRTEAAARDFLDPSLSGFDCSASQKRLKESLKQRLGQNIHEYAAAWDGKTLSYSHLKSLCEDVYTDLSRVILAEISRIETDEDIVQEINEHKAFCEEKARFFTGRQGILKQIQEYLEGSSEFPLLIYGQSGSGKTSLMAMAVTLVRKRELRSSIIARFVGATAKSSDGYSLLVSVFREISYLKYSEDDDFFNFDENIKSYDELIGYLKDDLLPNNRKERQLLFIDAVDQLPGGDPVGNLLWLPDKLPKNLRVIISTTPGPALASFEQRLPPKNILRLEPMSPDDGGLLLDLWLQSEGRTLQKFQKEEVLQKFSREGLPLFLSLAFTEARRWKSWSAPEDCRIPGDIPGIIGSMLSRLSAEVNHGNSIVSGCLGYLGASRNGLSEDEIVDLLSLDDGVMNDFRRRSPWSPLAERLPVVLWSRLYFDLEPYLKKCSIDGVSALSFYHRCLEQEVVKTYLSGAGEKPVRLKIADYFAFKNRDRRRAGELTWQLYKAEEWERLKNCLTDIGQFMEMASSEKEYDLLRYWQALTSKFDMLDELNKTFYRNSTLLLPASQLKTYYEKAASLLMLDARYDSARNLLQNAISLTGDPGKIQGESINLLYMARTSLNLGKLQEAESLLRQIISTSEKSDKQNTLAEALNELVNLQYTTGRFEEAETNMKRALSISEKVYGQDHDQTALYANNLGVLLMRENKLNDAEKYFRQTLNSYEKLYGPESPRIAIFVNNLAEVFNYQKNYAGAEPLYKRSLDIRLKNFGPEHPETAMSYGSLASLYYCQGKPAEALPLLEHALAIYEKSFGPESTKAAGILDYMASVLFTLRDRSRSDSAQMRAISIYEKALGPQNEMTVKARLKLEGWQKGKSQIISPSENVQKSTPRSFWKLWK